MLAELILAALWVLVMGADERPIGSWWRPAPGLAWQWQLQGAIDADAPAQVFDVDLFDASPAELHARGRAVICYVSSQFEEWRSDASRFPQSALGKPLDDWPGERWVWFNFIFYYFAHVFFFSFFSK